MMGCNKYAKLLSLLSIFCCVRLFESLDSSKLKLATRIFRREPLSEEQLHAFSDTFSSNDGIEFLQILSDHFDNYITPQCRTDIEFTQESYKNYTEAAKSPCKAADCECKSQNQLMLLENSWIKTLIDSYGKKGSYVEQGNIYWLGGYHECLSISAISKNQDDGQFKGRYCLLQNVKFNQLPSVCDKTSETPISVPLRYGVCIPRSCFEGNIDDNKMSYDVALDYTINFTLTCHDDLDISGDFPAIIMIVACCVIGLVLLMATTYDLLIYQRKISITTIFIPDKKEAENECYTKLTIPLKVLLSFSIYTNAAKILDTSKTAGQLDCVHGIRFLSLTWVILGHSYLLAALVTDNLIYFENVLYHFTEQTVLNSTFSVDTFFVLSGLLLSYLWLKETRNRSGKNLTSVSLWIMYYVMRFIRLTPPYMLIMGLDITLMRYFTNGPIWAQNGFEKNYCKDIWWTNLLYINNLVNFDNMCFSWSWFLANDMQYHWIAPLILIPLWFFPWVGITLSGLLIVGSSVANGIISYDNNYAPNQIDIFKNAAQFDIGTGSTDNVYIKPYTRAGPFFIGVILGYLLFHYLGKKLHLNQYFVAFMWFAAAALNLTVLYGLFNVATGAIMNKYVSAIYSAVARSVWGLGISWLVFACVTGNGGFINKFLSWSFFIPLSRLTYCAYLIHPLLLECTYFGRETAIHFDSDYTAVYFFLANVVLSYLLAFLATLAFESPVLGLMKIMFSKRKLL